MMPKPPKKIKWQSQIFPEMVLTEEHYTLLRQRLRYINSFREELEGLELWLSDNPHRAPKKNWRTFITNCMKRADRLARGRVHQDYSAESRKRYNAMARGLHEKVRVNKTVNPNEKYRCTRCRRIHSPGAACPREEQ